MQLSPSLIPMALPSSPWKLLSEQVLPITVLPPKTRIPKLVPLLSGPSLFFSQMLPWTVLPKPALMPAARPAPVREFSLHVLLTIVQPLFVKIPTAELGAWLLTPVLLMIVQLEVALTHRTPDVVPDIAVIGFCENQSI